MLLGLRGCARADPDHALRYEKFFLDREAVAHGGNKKFFSAVHTEDDLVDLLSAWEGTLRPAEVAHCSASGTSNARHGYLRTLVNQN